MEKNNLESYLKKLEQLDSEINDDSDPDELMKQVNDIVGSISKDIQVEVKELALTATLKFINRSDNPDPSFAHEGDSGFDLRAHLVDGIEYHIDPMRFATIPTGLYFEVEKGLEIQVRPRSGLADKFGIIILNTPGTVDSRYRGEVKIILGNLGHEKFIIKNGDRIAQGVVCPVYGEGNLNIIKVDELSITIRNDSGFGSSGIK